MLRCLTQVFRYVKPSSGSYITRVSIPTTNLREYSSLSQRSYLWPRSSLNCPTLSNNNQILNIANNLLPLSRTVIKFSLRKGKRKTVKAALLRFYRLHWGGWIRTKCGRHKKMWKKSQSRRRLLRQHVLCNATQSTLLDKMVTKFWKKPKYYIDDPYAPYHSREEFHITRKKPIVRD